MVKRARPARQYDQPDDFSRNLVRVSKYVGRRLRRNVFAAELIKRRSARRDHGGFRLWHRTFTALLVGHFGRSRWHGAHRNANHAQAVRGRASIYPATAAHAGPAVQGIFRVATAASDG